MHEIYAITTPPVTEIKDFERVPGTLKHISLDGARKICYNIRIIYEKRCSK